MKTNPNIHEKITQRGRDEQESAYLFCSFRGHWTSCKILTNATIGNYKAFETELRRGKHPKF